MDTVSTTGQAEGSHWASRVRCLGWQLVKTNPTHIQNHLP